MKGAFEFITTDHGAADATNTDTIVLGVHVLHVRMRTASTWNVHKHGTAATMRSISPSLA
jgi:hypothetical protein